MSYIKKIPLLHFIKRDFNTSTINYGKRNFRKFLLNNKRGTKYFKEHQLNTPKYKHLFHCNGVRQTGETQNGQYEHIPELIPELIVPNLDGFKLKPYVSYRVKEVVQTPFTPHHLFESIYGKKIIEDFNSGKLDESGNPLEPNENEKLTAEEAKNNARKTGSDIF